ncbi:hypothetical protein [Nocardia sp. NRRL S-836]|uniref:hypothetical protein n=1 Tax=Nocardia sp. NRRL S-836 TaxID=1519492 RepID=UPI0006B01F1B|nr:hypothetical protein [Nocardia sp. NRRL S-836]KOV84771.1 hypothetical protein ADL03_16025 [Nocardia sp. NRRL S-836]
MHYARRHIIGVQFAAGQWDDGHYLDSNGVILFHSGSTTSLEFDISDELNTACESVAATATLTIDLRTDQLIRNDDGTADIHTTLDVPCP